MPQLSIGNDFRFESEGGLFLLRHIPTDNTWEFSQNGDLDIPADLTGRVDKTIYDATEQKLTVENTTDDVGTAASDSVSPFYVSRRVH